MAHFYGTLQGQRGEASRLGSKNSGILTYTASWQGAVRCNAFVEVVNGKEQDWIEVSFVPWHGRGISKTIYRGPIGEYKPEVQP